MNPIRKIRKLIEPLRRARETSIRKSQNGSDFDRWSPEESLSSDWDPRTIQIATLVENHCSVLEFGAGRMVLKDHLPENCSYTPSDMVDRGDGTIVCDLNGSSLPELPECDYAVFSGVLEYVNDLSRLVGHLEKSFRGVIASYAILETNGGNRRKHGWVSDYTSEEFVALFANVRFEAVHREDWDSQRIFVFKKV